MLRTWEPDTPLHCYEFKTCTFWVRIFGLPLEWNSERMIKKIASSMGKVLEVKTDARGPAFQKIGKARVEIDVEAELRVGQLMSHGDKKVWLDFKYERLPFYCYSCGKIGHYATNCKDIPYDEEKFIAELGGCFGSWMRVETSEHSPFWKVFYHEIPVEANVEEVVPETPEQQKQNDIMEVGQPTNPIINQNFQQGGLNPSIATEVHMHNSGKRVLMLTGPEQVNNTDLQPATSFESSKKKNLSQHKTHSFKKPRKGNAQITSTLVQKVLDEAQLLETPILITEEAAAWAVVASPNKPPHEK
ncbi:hypothetical protein ACJRO7_026461 [Eucalyptus globulus]|uniref:CCHC-type domain-containing protein n=1 Tax=Eucalyptus globulus TaxID=34317 RepID=A0ABD3JVB0_EUCGL